MKKFERFAVAGLALLGAACGNNKSRVVYEIPKPPEHELCISVPDSSDQYSSLDTNPEVVALANYSHQRFMRSPRNLDTPTPEEIAAVAKNCPPDIFDRAANTLDAIGDYTGGRVIEAKELVHPN